MSFTQKMSFRLSTWQANLKMELWPSRSSGSSLHTMLHDLQYAMIMDCKECAILVSKDSSPCNCQKAQPWSRRAINICNTLDGLGSVASSENLVNALIADTISLMQIITNRQWHTTNPLARVKSHIQPLHAPYEHASVNFSKLVRAGQQLVARCCSSTSTTCHQSQLQHCMASLLLSCFASFAVAVQLFDGMQQMQ